MAAADCNSLALTHSVLASGSGRRRSSIFAKACIQASTSASIGSKSDMTSLRRESAPGQDCCEAFARAEKHHANASRFHTHGIGDLFMRRAFDVREPQKRAFLRLELREHAHHVVPQVDVGGRAHLDIGSQLAMPSGFAKMIEDQVR